MQVVSQNYSSRWHDLPFPHLVLSDFIAVETLPAFVARFPATAQMSRARECVAAGECRHCWLNPGFIARNENQADRNFWSDFISALDRQTRSAVLPALRLPGLKSAEDVALTFRLVRETLPYTLPPHLDRDTKLGTIVAYLDCDHRAGRGTHLYRYDSGALILAKRMDFEINSAVYITRSEASWHGGDWAGAGCRRTLHIYIQDRTQPPG